MKIKSNLIEKINGINVFEHIKIADEITTFLLYCLNIFELIY